jgi:hypothetical protein
LWRSPIVCGSNPFTKFTPVRKSSFLRLWFIALLTGPLLAQSGESACRTLAGIHLENVQITEAPYSPATLDLPAHCIVRGRIDQRIGVGGQPFAIRFELRLPDDWQGRFLFQGGGGMDGLVRPAIGRVSGSKPALARGFATVSTDAGHEGKDPDPSADPSFARDQQARIDNAYRSIERVANVAKSLILARYGRPPSRSYFAGCSNGGRQGLMAAQRFPTEFDGIISGAPAFRVTKAAIGSAWETIAFQSIAPKDANGKPILSQAFSDSDLKLVADRILQDCDTLDGVRDGLVFNREACHFDPTELVCRDSNATGCLREEQVRVLKKVFGGPVNSRGEAIYSDWPYDPGIASAGWRALKLGTSTTAVPNSINYTLMFSGLKGYFFFPPDPTFDPLQFDFDHDPVRVADTAALQDPTSTQYSTFIQHGGKLLLYHGMSDPFFSANDTIRYYNLITAHNGGTEKTLGWARLFLVPGMTHCEGGPALDRFDSLSAMVDWVEKGVTPDRITASGKAFPNLTRPLCRYPGYAAYSGIGDSAQAENFTCR